MSSRAIALAVVLVASACYGIPEDTRVDRLAVKAWGGAVGTCQELLVDLDAARAARGICDAVDPSTATAVPQEIVEAIRSGIESSEFATDDAPVPDCAGCPTRTYTVHISSASANLESRARIDPSAELALAVAPLSPP